MDFFKRIHFHKMSETKKKLVESGSLTLIKIYLNYFLGIFDIFLVARLITPEEWALLLLAISFVGLATYFCNFVPPAAGNTIQYFIPKTIAEGKDSNNKIRSFILYIYKIKLSFSIIISAFYLLIMCLLNFEHVLFQIILILLPLIFLNVINNLNSSIIIAYYKFKFGFVLGIINSLIYTITLLFIFIFQLENPLILIAYFNLLSMIFSSIISFIYIIQLIPRRDITSKTSFNYKKEFSNLHKRYGLYLVIAGGFAQIGGLLNNMLYLLFGFLSYITYVSICEKTASTILRISSSNESINVSIFSQINEKEDTNKFKKYFFYLIKYYTLFICLFIGFFFFYIEIIISIVYSEIYLVILNAIQICIFTAFSRMFARNLMMVLNSTNNTKYTMMYNLIQAIIFFITIFIGLIYFEFFIIMLFYVIATFFLNYILFLLVNKATNLKFRFIKLYRAFILFLISILITIPLNLFINIHLFTDNNFLHLLINSSIKFGIFLLIFYIIIYISRFITLLLRYYL